MLIKANYTLSLEEQAELCERNLKVFEEHQAVTQAKQLRKRLAWLRREQVKQHTGKPAGITSPNPE